MENSLSTPAKGTGWLLIIGAVGVLIPYTILATIFDYPHILRQETAIVLTRFHEGGSRLIGTWFAFAWTGVPLIPAYIRLGQMTGHRSMPVRVATTIGIVGLVVQIIGLLRWTFVVPVLANSFVNAADEATKAAVVVAFQTMHQFAGVILGEHLGQVFTIIWTVLMSFSFARLKLFPRWINPLGFVSAAVYLLAQGELFATVIPGFPVWGAAGLIGSTLWLTWLLVVGIRIVVIKRT